MTHVLGSPPCTHWACSTGQWLPVALRTADLRTQMCKPSEVSPRIMGSDREKDSREGHLTCWLWHMVDVPASTVRSPPSLCTAVPCSVALNQIPSLSFLLEGLWGPSPWLPLTPLSPLKLINEEAVLRERLFSVQFSASLWLGPKVKLSEQPNCTSSCCSLMCFCVTQTDGDFKILVTGPAVKLT